jgi:hypothetical protein
MAQIGLREKTLGENLLDQHNQEYSKALTRFTIELRNFKELYDSSDKVPYIAPLKGNSVEVTLAIVDSIKAIRATFDAQLTKITEAFDTMKQSACYLDCYETRFIDRTLSGGYIGLTAIREMEIAANQILELDDVNRRDAQAIRRANALHKKLSDLLRKYRNVPSQLAKNLSCIAELSEYVNREITKVSGLADYIQSPFKTVPSVTNVPLPNVSEPGNISLARRAKMITSPFEV